MFYVRRDNPAMTGMFTDASWVRGWGASIDVPGGPCVQKGHYVAVGVQCVPRRTNRRWIGGILGHSSQGISPLLSVNEQSNCSTIAATKHAAFGIVPL